MLIFDTPAKQNLFFRHNLHDLLLDLLVQRVQVFLNALCTVLSGICLCLIISEGLYKVHWVDTLQATYAFSLALLPDNMLTEYMQSTAESHKQKCI